jgi:ABC-type multidrug transport system ATPase subunit
MVAFVSVQYIRKGLEKGFVKKMNYVFGIEMKKDEGLFFINGPTGVGKSTLAKGLYNHYREVYIEQHMIPEFYNYAEDVNQAAILE